MDYMRISSSIRCRRGQQMAVPTNYQVRGFALIMENI
jgi:hypothetical protein